MSTATIQNKIKEQTHKVIEKYKQRGYEVIISPKAEQLPESIGKYTPDLIAFSPHEAVVIQVKTHDELKRSSELEELAEIVNKDDKLRLELILIGVEPHEEQFISPEITEETILERSKVAVVLANNDYLDASILLLWSAFEGAAHIFSSYIPSSSGKFKYSAISIYKQLYSLGVLSYPEYESLIQFENIRDAIAHGNIVYDIEKEEIEKLSTLLVTTLAMKNEIQELLENG